MSNEFLFVEKYRPKKVSETILPPELKQTFQSIVDGGEILNMMFTGSAGTGKTTVAKAICEELELDYIVINGSEEGNIDTLRGKIRQFASSVSLSGGYKVVILDEADYLNPQSTQPALRGFIEEFSNNCRFIMTCNYVERIIDPLQSRCQVLKIIPPSKGDVAKHIAWILGEENTSFSIGDIKIITNQFYPDLRKCLNTVQLSTQDSKLIIDKSVLVSSNYMTQVLKELSNAKPLWREIRQTIANANVQDFEELYRYLYDNASTYANGREGMVAVYINEYSYQSNFRIDKEINAMALISKLIELK